MTTPVIGTKDPQVSWTDPTQNVDGAPITSGELSGYQIGIRDVSAAGSVAGTYSLKATVAGGGATSALMSALGFLAFLFPGGTYAVAAESEVGGAAVGAWSPEFVFTYSPPAPVPNAPTALKVA
jgi:hypothetical protein